MTDDDQERIMDEIIEQSKGKGITRFISTHPDDDHFQYIEYYDKRKTIENFYCVKNEATKSDETDSFKKYKEFRDAEKRFMYIEGVVENG